MMGRISTAVTSISGFFNVVSASGNVVEDSEDNNNNSEQGPHGLGGPYL